MINLMPNDIKEQLIYGRRNRLLLRWLFAVFVVIVVVVAMTVFGQFYINRNINSLQAVAKTTKQRIEEQNLATVQKDILALSNNFKIVTQLLSKQLLFSKMFVKIGGIISKWRNFK